ncbi:MAG: hypothetical protein NTV04_19895 [Deltaproteobacteria bacterium]|nr:hypothetical protein [Deltaproteobacteria bacterium]
MRGYLFIEKIGSLNIFLLIDLSINQFFKSSILAISALITPALVSMQRAIDLLKEKGLRDRTYVIIGGRFPLNS